MKPASQSIRTLSDTKLLLFTEKNKVKHSKVKDLVEYFNSGDLIVVNLSSTLPSSFIGKLARTKERVEIRLAAFQGPNSKVLDKWLAFSFGKGDSTTPTEKRGPPPLIIRGDEIVFGPDLSAKIKCIKFSRLLELEFQSKNTINTLYKYGQPIQYSYLKKRLKIWDQQTIFSGPPISVESPSAVFPMNWELYFRLKSKGVGFASILHSGGISSTGDKKLDALLPLPEWSEVSVKTAKMVDKTRKANRRVIAWGTTALRALECAWRNGQVQAAAGLVEMKIQSNQKIRSATSLVTGLHDSKTSHFEMMASFCPRRLVEKGYRQAEKLGYVSHEYGDITLLDCR